MHALEIYTQNCAILNVGFRFLMNPLKRFAFVISQIFSKIWCIFDILRKHSFKTRLFYLVSVTYKVENEISNNILQFEEK